MSRRLGERIAAENLQIGKPYNVKRRSGEATVKITALEQDGVEAEIVQGGFDAFGQKYRKGQTVKLPYDGDWFVPQI